MDQAFTSQAATASIASRVVREIDRHTHAPIDAVAKIILPTALLIRKRGKLSRPELKPTFERLLRDLAAARNVIDVDVARCVTSSKLKDSFNVRFIQSCGSIEDEVVFLAIDLSMTRHKISMMVNSANFYVTAHVLQRYMYRGRKSYHEFMASVRQPMMASSMLAIEHAKQHCGQNFALPMAEGLLLGKVEVAAKDEDQIFPMRLEFDRHGRTSTVDKEHGVPDRTISTVMRTFIDRDSLSQKKQRILDKLVEWEHGHRQGIEACFDAFAFGGVRIRSEYGQDAVLRDTEEALKSGHALVTSPEWQELAMHVPLRTEDHT